jgi:F0F1-type ATP synthase assembly protein I
MTDPSPPSPKKGFNLREMKGVGMLSTVGLTLVICSVIGTGLGDLIDRKWGTSPWGIAGGFLFGTAAGFIEMFKTVMKANDDD